MFSPGRPPEYKPSAAVAHFPEVLQEAQYCTVKVEPWSASWSGPSLTDHFIYDLWFNVQTDEDVTRFWTNWAASLGARV